MKKRGPDALVITDTEGNYYVLPRELLEVSRIEPKAKARVDKLLRAEKPSRSRAAIEYSALGTVALPDESQWTHFTPSVAWPNGVASPGRQHPANMIMLDKPVISARKSK